MLIYKITNLVNQKVYIGLTTKTITKRWNRHLNDASVDNPSWKVCVKIRNAIRKYGKDNFIIEQIDTALSLEELNAKEEQWIKYYNSVDCGYNIRPGGNFSPFNPETIAKIAAKSRGRVCTEETRKKLSDRNKGKHNNPEVGKKISVKIKGTKHTKEFCLLQKERTTKMWQEGYDFKIVNTPVYQYDLNANLVTIHKSIADAERKIGISTRENLFKTSYRIRYHDGFIYAIESADKEKIKEIANKYSTKKVLCFNKDRNLIKVYNHINEARIAFKVDWTTIKSKLNTNKPYKGFYLESSKQGVPI